MKNYIYLIVILIFFYAIIQFFQEDSPSEYAETMVEKEDDSFNDLMLTYLNEIEKLKEEVKGLSRLLYESNILLVESNAIIEILPSPETTEIIHREQRGDNYIFIYKDIEGYSLIIFNKEVDGVQTQLDYLDSQIFNWEYRDGNIAIAGLSRMESIYSLKVIVDKEQIELQASQVEDELLRYWYVQVEIESKELLFDSKIVAYDKDGNVMMEEYLTQYR